MPAILILTVLTNILRFLKIKVISVQTSPDLNQALFHLQENMVVLFSDLTMHELKVLPRDLQLCSDMATGVDSLGQFQFGDMVQLDAQTVGVIVQIQKENFQVRTVNPCLPATRTPRSKRLPSPVL
jgi:transcription elongation factor SPT5